MVMQRPAMDTAVMRARPSPLPHTPDFGWFAGQVPRARVNGAHFTQRGSGSIRIEMPTVWQVEAAVVTIGVDREQSIIPILFVHAPGSGRAHLMVAQRGDDALLRVGTRGETLGFPAPDLVLPGVFRVRSDAVERELTATVSPERWSFTARYPDRGAHRTDSVVASPGSAMGWALIIPGIALDARRARWSIWPWYAAIVAFPLYWTIRAIGTRRSAR